MKNSNLIESQVAKGDVENPLKKLHHNVKKKVDSDLNKYKYAKFKEGDSIPFLSQNLKNRGH